MGIFEIGSQKLFAQEMNQALYAHMNNKRKMKKKKTICLGWFEPRSSSLCLLSS
jgi:hypothetical protein